MRIIVIIVLLCMFSCISNQIEDEYVNNIIININIKVNTPKNVIYNKKSIDINKKAAGIIKKLLSEEKLNENNFDKFFTCGPFLWKRISTINEFKKLNGPEMNIANLNLTGKLIMDDQTGVMNLFNYIKKEIVKKNKIVIRNLNEEELLIYWGTIMFDIEDPIFIIEGDNIKYFIKLSNDFKVAYLDDFSGISLKKDKTTETINEEVEKFLEFCNTGDYVSVQQYIDKDNSLINCQDNYGNSALMCAITSNNIELIQFLINQGIDVNHRNNNMDSSLHYAVASGNLEIVKILVSNGCKINVKNNQHVFPFLMSVIRNYPDIRDFLLENGADPNLKEEK